MRASDVGAVGGTRSEARKRAVKRVPLVSTVEPVQTVPQTELESWFLWQYPAQKEVVELVVQRVLAGGVDAVLDRTEVWDSCHV